MGWVRIDDSFYDHTAMAGLPLEAWGLWCWSLAWSNRNLTDGHIPAAVVRRMDPDGMASKALVDAGRWVDDGTEIVIHDYHDYQPSDHRPHMPRSLRASVFERDEHRCRRCGATSPLELDHVVPLARGGAFAEEANLQTLCGPCNRSKGARIDA